MFRILAENINKVASVGRNQKNKCKRENAKA